MNKGLSLCTAPKGSLTQTIEGKDQAVEFYKKTAKRSPAVLLHRKHSYMRRDKLITVHYYCVAWEENVCRSEFPKDGWEIMDTRGL